MNAPTLIVILEEETDILGQERHTYPDGEISMLGQESEISGESDISGSITRQPREEKESEALG